MPQGAKLLHEEIGEVELFFGAGMGARFGIGLRVDFYVFQKSFFYGHKKSSFFIVVILYSRAEKQDGRRLKIFPLAFRNGFEKVINTKNAKGKAGKLRATSSRRLLRIQYSAFLPILQVIRSVLGEVSRLRVLWKREKTLFLGKSAAYLRGLTAEKVFLTLS